MAYFWQISPNFSNIKSEFGPYLNYPAISAQEDSKKDHVTTTQHIGNDYLHHNIKRLPKYHVKILTLFW